VAVDSRFRGRGIGKELMLYFLEEGCRRARSAGAVLEVRSGNAAALAVRKLRLYAGGAAQGVLRRQR
jgi:ribosomal protein S18 acetylase RimI-like enzyme